MIRPVQLAATLLALARAVHAMPQDAPPHEQAHQHDAGATLFHPREGSGTSWRPDATTMTGTHASAGPWRLMVHGVAFAQFLYESGEEHRRSRQAGSINWLMGAARRPVGPGWLGLRGMVSAEPATIGGCGYPDLLATGETCDGDTIHDRQHPHDLLMELAVEYDRPLGRALRWHVYGGPAGEPALGPPAFPHRVSAAPNPIAPISHHWLDATHISFGVVTAGVSGGRWRVEASAFNGREPDESRFDLEMHALDSVSARLTWMPAPSLSVQVSAGRLDEAEGHPGLPRLDVVRATASGIYHRTLPGGTWATTVAWGANREDGEVSHAVLVESSAGFGRHALFGRVEVNGKPADDLHVHESHDVFTVGKIQLGYTRYWPPRGLWQAGYGGSVSAAILPPALAPRYGGRVVPGFGVFLTVRPAVAPPPAP
jgi:hypothetical protein